MDCGRWARIVDRVFWDTSVADPVRDSAAVCQDPASSITCPLCPQSAEVKLFATPKALQAHQRVKHGIRSPMRLFADESGECRVCGTQFGTRLRLLAHLCDSRRPKCRDVCLSGSIPPIAADEVGRLDLIDRDLKRSAARCGHTPVLATGAARRKDGRVIGVATL